MHLVPAQSDARPVLDRVTISLPHQADITALACDDLSSDGFVIRTDRPLPMNRGLAFSLTCPSGLSLRVVATCVHEHVLPTLPVRYFSAWEFTEHTPDVERALETLLACTHGSHSPMDGLGGGL